VGGKTLFVEDHVTIEQLHELFEADFVRGHLRWRVRTEVDRHVRAWNSKHAGKIAGRPNTAGAIQISFKIEGVRFHSTVHRVLWALKNNEWLPRDLMIDHQFGCKSDNRHIVLRKASIAQNSKNKLKYRNNTSGFKGVSWYPRYSKWMAYICINKRLKNLGYFECKIAAAKAYDTAAKIHFGEFARTNASLGLFDGR
jgi:hypothetical protein